MVYKSNIPQPSDRLAASQRDFLNNYGTVYTDLNADHADINASDVNAFKHRKVELPVQGAAPATGATEQAMYALQDTISVNAHLRAQANGADYKLTAGNFLAQNTDNVSIGGQSIGIRLEAWVMWAGGSKLNIGDKCPIYTVGGKNAKSPNVVSVTVVDKSVYPIPASFCPTFKINFSPPLSSDNYFWDLGVWAQAGKKQSLGFAFKYPVIPPSGTYSDSVATNFFICQITQPTISLEDTDVDQPAIFTAKFFSVDNV